jgi:uncharacterized protein
MPSTVTLNTRTLIVVGLVLMAVITTYSIASARADSSPDSAGAPAADTRPAPDAAEPSLVMTGTGEAVGVPDQLSFALAVKADGDSVSEALGRANAISRRVLSTLRDEGVRSEDIQTTGLSIDPRYDYNDYGPPVLLGYAVTQRASVLVRSLADAGDALSSAVEAGGDAVRLGGLRLQLGDKDALLRQARAAAVEEATAKAEEYADATGRTLGEVTSVRELVATPRAPEGDYYALKRATVSADLSRVPIRAGSSDLKVTVAVAWSFA